MSGVSRFENLIAWQKARELTRVMYEPIRCSSYARCYMEHMTLVISLQINSPNSYKKRRKWGE